MTVLAMDVLPDCAVCFGPVVLVVDDDGRAVEACDHCELTQPAMSSMRGIPAAVRLVRVLARAGDLQPVLCPACTAGRHGTCHRVRCTCDHGAQQ